MKLRRPALPLVAVSLIRIFPLISDPMAYHGDVKNVCVMMSIKNIGGLV